MHRARELVGDNQAASHFYKDIRSPIETVEAAGADDAEEQAFKSLDLIQSFQPTDRLSLKLKLQNLLDEDTVIEQGGVAVLTQDIGTTARMDLSYRF